MTNSVKLSWFSKDMMLLRSLLITAAVLNMRRQQDVGSHPCEAISPRAPCEYLQLDAGWEVHTRESSCTVCTVCTTLLQLWQHSLGIGWTQRGMQGTTYSSRPLHYPPQVYTSTVITRGAVSQYQAAAFAVWPVTFRTLFD
jgi:hypothetical protein